jgi:hypothetical protein
MTNKPLGTMTQHLEAIQNHSRSTGSWKITRRALANNIFGGLLTKIDRASRIGVIIVSAVDGLSPLIFSLIVLIPLLITLLNGNILISYTFCIAMSLPAWKCFWTISRVAD